MTRGVFITGTDTDVDKTRLGAALAHLLTKRGLNVRQHKPVGSGCPTVPDGPPLQDGVVLREAAGSIEPLESICRYRLQGLQMTAVRLLHGSGVATWRHEAASLLRLADAWLSGISVKAPWR